MSGCAICGNKSVDGYDHARCYAAGSVEGSEVEAYDRGYDDGYRQAIIDTQKSKKVMDEGGFS